MSRKRGYTDDQLRRILEESDYEAENQSNSSDDAESLGDDDSVADPDFIPSELIELHEVNLGDTFDDEEASNEAPIQPVCSTLSSEVNSQMFRTFTSDVPVLPNSDSSDSISSNETNTAVRAPRNAASRTSAPRPITDYQMKQHDESQGWNYDILPLRREDFTGENFLHIDHIPENSNIFTIYRLLVDDEVLELMVHQTNLYAEQSIAANPGGRLSRWKPVNNEDIKKFLGIYLLTGIIRFPSLECYWKRDSIYYHPLMHMIKMSYNRFVAILRCWHFVDNTAERDENDRLYKVKPIVDIVMKNCRKLLTPKDCVVVDESMVPFQGRLLIRQYNPNKTHKYGLKIYKATTDDGYVWKYKVYTGQDPQISNLDKPGSVIVELCEELLDQGRIIIADNWYTSVPLAEFLLSRKTYLCGTLRKNRKQLPLLVKNKKLNRGEHIAAQRNNVTVLKWKDKRDVLMISTCHADEQTLTTGRIERQKPNMILEYNKRKKGIDLSDELASYYSPIRKSLTWYKKIAVDVLLGVAVINALYLYKKLNPQDKCSLLQAQTDIVKNLVDVNNIQLPAPAAVTPQQYPTASSSQRQNVRPLQAQHFLQMLDKKDGKLQRRRCTGCYEQHRLAGETAQAATNKAKRVSQICNICTKPYCLQCFQKVHI